MEIRAVLETCLYAADLEAAERFYSATFGLETIAREKGRHVFFRCGAGVLLLFNPETTAREVSHVGDQPIPLHGAHGPGHVAFAAPLEEIPAWRERLTGAGVEIETEVRWPGGGHSLYFRDPAGNSVEIATPRIWGLPEGSS